MASLHSIFQDIALIISDQSDTELLQEKIRNNAFDWEAIVPVASKHLIIPLIYFKLKNKNCLELLPEDLESYLKEIARQNTDRNQTILEEVLELSALLQSEKIDHVFLKGAAMLASGMYKHMGERMIGDIDILVKKDQLLTAQDFLIKNGYNPVDTTFGQQFNEHKHLARLVPAKNLAAVEIHRKLLSKPSRELSNSDLLLESKQQINGVSVLNYKNFLLHTILNFEINDLGYYYNYLGLRNTYDALLLSNDTNEERKREICDNKYVKSFLRKLSTYFRIGSFISMKKTFNLRSNFFVLKQKSRFIRISVYRFLSMCHFVGIIMNRFFMFLNNSKYRKEALKDKKRIYNLIQKKIKNLY